jgi:hypothetical protein
MTSYISASLRREVIERASERCEYCLMPQRITLSTFEVEHIIAEKHRGLTESTNLALACSRCNRLKGSDPGSYDPQTGLLVPFFHPRRQNWDDHFRLELNGFITPLTAEGRVTVLIFNFNLPERVQERELLIEAGLYPG